MGLVGAYAGINVMPVNGMVTNESGGSAAFSVALTSQPLNDVTIATSSSNTSEGTVAPQSLVFTHENWNVSQQVTVTGADDAIDDGDVLYDVLTAPAVSADGKYHGLNAIDPAVTNEDDDTAGITVVAEPNLRTTESGDTAQFTVVLDTQPTSNVRIPFSSSNPNEGDTSIRGVTFTGLNWSSVQTVTITGVDDAIVDGDVAYTIDISAATGDPTYLGLQPVPTVPVVNEDNDTASVILTPENGIQVVEGGAAASVAVELGSQPSGNVTVSLSVSPSSQATLSTNSLTFAPGSGTIPDGVITVDGGGSGTLEDDGMSDFVSTAGSADGCSYTGGFSIDGVNASGSWQATRVSSLRADVEHLAAVSAPSLTIEQANTIVPSAAYLWRDNVRLEGIELRLVDLPGSLLGLASSEVIYLDHNAAGHGWFIDATPGEHEEFTIHDGVYQALGDSHADGKIDLLTVLAHEMGHLLGFGDLDSDLHTDDIMADTLPPGARRLPWAEAVDHALGKIR